MMIPPGALAEGCHIGSWSYEGHHDRLHPVQTVNMYNVIYIITANYNLNMNIQPSEVVNWCGWVSNLPTGPYSQ